MKTIYKQYGVTASITDKRDGTARLVVRDAFSQKVREMCIRDRNISDRQVYASPFLFRNLVVILRDFSQWFGGQTSLDWYTKAKPVIEFLLA